MALIKVRMAITMVKTISHMNSPDAVPTFRSAMNRLTMASRLVDCYRLARMSHG